MHYLGIGAFLSSIAISTVLILLAVIVGSMVNRRFSKQARRIAVSELQTQLIFDNLKEGFVVIDRDRNVVKLNKAASNLLGIPETMRLFSETTKAFELFLPTGELVPPAAWPGALAFQGEFIQNRELKVRRTDTGKTAIAEVSAAPIVNSAGETIQVIISYRDITQPKKIDEARKRLSAIVESSEDAIIDKDESGIVTSWNLGAEKVFGYSSREMIGRSITLLLPDDRLHEEEDILARIKRGEFVDHIETVRKKKNGQFIHVSLSVSPIRDATGRIVGASKIARNITERKQMESQLLQSQKMDAVGQLTGGIAHDFNNLLGVVIGNLDLLERQVQDNPAALKRVQTAQKASMRGAELTRRLLAFSSREELRPSAIDLNASIQNAIELAARALGPEIKITLQLSESVPAVFADLAGLESALLNLLVNARDAMPRGGVITVTSEVANIEGASETDYGEELAPGRYAYVSVSDTGTGMTREVIARAFEPFFTTKPRGKGTGLGLAMIYGFFRQSKGTVRIYSEVGYGTTVSFYLPLAENVTVVPRRHAQGSQVRGEGAVLVVDDESDLLEIAVSYLSEMGFSALQAIDGPTALAVIRKRPDISLLITDIVMPGGMNGAELAEAARLICPKMKVIYCSGFPAGALVERSLPMTDGPLLHKPYQRKEFNAIVHRMMFDGEMS